MSNPFAALEKKKKSTKLKPEQASDMTSSSSSIPARFVAQTSRQQQQQQKSDGFVTVSKREKKKKDPNVYYPNEPTPPDSSWKTLHCWASPKHTCKYQQSPQHCEYYHSESEAVCLRCGVTGHIADRCIL